MFGNKNAAGLWRLLPVVACAAALLSVGVCACVIFGAKSAAKPSALQSAQQHSASATGIAQSNTEQSPLFRAFNGGLEMLQNGVWVPMEALDAMQQSDPLSVALQAYMQESGFTPPPDTASNDTEEPGAPRGQQSAQSRQERIVRGTVPEKRDSRTNSPTDEAVKTPVPVVTPPQSTSGGSSGYGGPIDIGVEESNAYL